MMKIRILILSSLLILLASTALAQARRSPVPTRAQRWEFSLQTRYTASRDFAGEVGTALSLQDDLGWGFGFAYNLNQRWNLGFVVAWRSIPYTATTVDAEDPDNKNDYASQLDLSTFALTGMWNILQGPITPFVSGAIGWTMVDTNIYAGSYPGCWWDPWWGQVCGVWSTTYGTNTASYNVGVGGRFELGDSFFLRIAYEYNYVDVESFEGTNIIRLDIGWMLGQ